MNNVFPFSDDNKRYHTQNYYMRHRYGEKVCKIPLSGGFSCPNRDGSKATGGCVFCSSSGSGEFAGNPADSISRQISLGKQMMHQKWPNAKFLAYFQPFSGTYADTNTLKRLYDAALDDPDILGLCIATRPDCLPDEVCQLLGQFNKQTDLYVELGLQTIHDSIADRLNRQHSYQDFLIGYQKLQKYNIRVCIHIIDGLPHETMDMMLQTAQEIAKLKPFAVKIHLLHVLKNTVLADWYCNHTFTMISREEYIQVVCNQLEQLPAQTVIERLTGDGRAEDLIAPQWSLKKFTVLNDIDKELVRRNSWQGKFFHESLKNTL